MTTGSGGGTVGDYQEVEERIVEVRRRDWDRVILRNRRMRTLLVECGRLLISPGPSETQLARRADLLARIKKLVDE